MQGFVSPYDYSQPITINIDSGATAGASDGQQAIQTAAQPPSPQAQQAFTIFDQARTEFSAGNYPAALASIDKAIRQNPIDSVLHEFRALCLFATGKYDACAAVLNSLLASAPGWDWTTMSGLYTQSGDYERQLRNLEMYAGNHPQKGAPHFVLAYHYMVAGYPKEAIDQLKIVMANEPNDVVAGQILASLDPKEVPAPAVATNAPAAAAPVAPRPGGVDAAPTEAAKPVEEPSTDLVGNWQAKRPDGANIALRITEVGGFEWKVTSDKSKPIDLSGKYSVDGNFLILDGQKQGSMVGQVNSQGPDKFGFVMVGGPPGDKGLEFERVK